MSRRAFPQARREGSIITHRDPNIGSIYPGTKSPVTTPAMLSRRYSSFEEEQEISPEDGALQFVPALGSSGDTRLQEASWDAILDEKKESTERLSTSAMAVKARQYRQTRQEQQHTRQRSVEDPGQTGRISRIASLFTSRAVVRGDNVAGSPLVERNRSWSAPPSPAQSSSSSGYVGWPGTLDKTGKIMSFDDSSAAGPELVEQQKKYQNELREAAEREMERWTGGKRSPVLDETFTSTSSSFSLTPERTTLVDRRTSPKSSIDTGRPLIAIQASSPGRASKMSMTAMRYAQTEAARSSPKQSESVTTSEKRIAPRQSPMSEPWKSPDSNAKRSSPTSQASKSPSDYFQVTDNKVSDLAYPDLTKPYPLRGNRSGTVKSSLPTPASPTEGDLAANDLYSPPHRTFHAKGYRGLIEKTKEVPSLMDAVDSDSMASSKATSTYSSVVRGGGPKNLDIDDAESDVFDDLSIAKESDVFDNLSSYETGKTYSPRKSQKSYPERIDEELCYDGKSATHENDGAFNVVLLGGGLTAIQSTAIGFSKRQTASDYDENLTNSDVDQYGYAKTPGFRDMISAGVNRDNSLLGIQTNIGRNKRNRSVDSGSGSSLFTDPYENDRMNIDGDLSEYYIPPEEMKKVIRKYRQLADRIDVEMSLSDFEKEEDEHKAFALFEMRSRIMEKDIERGLERRGGTVPVDDIVTTAYFLKAQRIRDAVIVSKAWRDGATPKDVVKSALLTHREHTYLLKRPGIILSQRYYWEPVEWVDDTDFALYRCPSLGPRHMHGFEMFTIGDCQSILLKLTHERCNELRLALNEATKAQLEAEECLKDEVDAEDGFMTDAEMAYLAAMEDVKMISKKLVCAEQAFALVRDRIEKLVLKYHCLLSKIESSSFAGASSVITMESSYYSEHSSRFWEEQEEHEREIWARRAQRAEVKAEIAAREALLAKQEARLIREKKERELEELRQKLIELRSESSYGAPDPHHSASIAKSLTMRRHDSSSPVPEGAGVVNRGKIDEVKKRFRERMAQKKQFSAPLPSSNGYPPRHSSVTQSFPASTPLDLIRSAGEEMCQQLDFYERSLRAVEVARN